MKCLLRSLAAIALTLGLAGIAPAQNDNDPAAEGSSDAAEIAQSADDLRSGLSALAGPLGDLAAALGSVAAPAEASTDEGGDEGGAPDPVGVIARYKDDPMLIVEDLKGVAINYGPILLKALAIYLIGMWIARILVKALRKILVKAKVDETLSNFLGNLAHMGIAAMVVVSAIGALGVPTTSFAAILGAAGLAVGFALQGSLGNFAAGVMIMLFRPFKVGDFIEAGGHAGSIEEIQVFATIMKTGDNKKIILPNSSVTGGSITNYSAKPTRRIDMVMGIGYEDDMKQARDVMAKILEADDRVLKDPAFVIAVDELADSSVNFVVRPWVKSSDYWAAKWDLTETIKAAFDKEGISIPYPQQDVHMHEVKS